MAKYDPLQPSGPSLQPPKPSRPGPQLKPIKKPTVSQELATVKQEIKTAEERKREKEKGIQFDDVISAAFKTPAIFTTLMAQAPVSVAQMIVGQTQPAPIIEDLPAAARIPLTMIGVTKTGQEIVEGYGRTLSGKNLKEAYRAVEAGESPLPYVMEDAGNIALVAGVAGAAAGKVASTATSAAARSAAARTASTLRPVARVGNLVGDAPIELPIRALGKGFNKYGAIKRNTALKLYQEADALERVNPANAEIEQKRARARLIESRYGKDVMVDGKPLTLTNVALNKMANRARRRMETAPVEIDRAFINIVDRPAFYEDINPATNEPYGPLSAVEQEAVIASLNGRGNLVRRIARQLGQTPGRIAWLGRYNMYPEYSLSEAGAKLAVDFIEGTLDEVQTARLAEARSRLSQELEGVSAKAREGYGRRSKLSPAYDVPTPMPDRLATALNNAGRADLAEQIVELAETGFFENLQDPDVQNFLQTIVEQSPASVALDQTIYPAKERNNIVFYKRVREALEANAAFTVRGTPPPAEPGGPRVTPMTEGPAAGLPPETRYTDVKYPGELSRTPRKFIVNSIKALNKLSGRARQLGERIADAEISMAKKERALIKIALRIEEIQGGWVDRNGYRVVPDENGRVPADAEYIPGLLEVARQNLATLRAKYDEMLAEQATSTVINNKVVSIDELAQVVAEGVQAIQAIEASVDLLEQQMADTEAAIRTIDDEQADLAIALEDEGVNPDEILQASLQDAENILDSEEGLPEARPGDVDAQVAQAALADAQATLEKVAAEREAARLAEIDARGKVQDLQDQYRGQSAPTPPAVETPVTEGMVSASQLLATLQQAVEAGDFDADALKGIEQQFDTTYVAPKADKDVAKNVDALLLSSKEGGYRHSGATPTLINTVNNELWFADKYVAGLLPPDSKSGAVFKGPGRYTDEWGQTLGFKTVGGRTFMDRTIGDATYRIEEIVVGKTKKGTDQKKYILSQLDADGNVIKDTSKSYGSFNAAKDASPKSTTSEAPNIQALVDVARKEKTDKQPPATIEGRRTGVVGTGKDAFVINYVFLRGPDGRLMFVDETNLGRIYKTGDTIHLPLDGTKPVVVKRGKKIVGIVMPIRTTNPFGDVGDPLSPDSIATKLVNDGAIPAEIVAALQQTAEGPRLAPIAEPTSTAEAVGQQLDAAQDELSAAQDAVRIADNNYLAAANALRAAEEQVAATPIGAGTPEGPRLTPPKRVEDAVAETVEQNLAEDRPVLEEAVRLQQPDRTAEPEAQISALTEDDWTLNEDGSYGIDTGFRRYEVTKLDAGKTKAGKPKSRYELRRYGSDGQIIDTSTQVFSTFAAARKYVQETIDIDKQVSTQRAIYRPGRELTEGSKTGMPPELIKAEKQVADTEIRLGKLRNQEVRITAALDKARVRQARDRALLPMVSSAAARLEARLGKEILTQPDLAFTETGPTGRVFESAATGRPSVIRPLREGDVPTAAGSPVGAPLRPTSEYNIDQEGPLIVSRSIDEANLRRAQELPPSLPLRSAREMPVEQGQTFLGSQYVPAGRQTKRSRGARREVDPGYTGDILLSSERLRTGESYEYYNIIELAKRISAERRQMELNEAFRFLLASAYAVSPEELLGAADIARLEKEAYDQTYGYERAADGSATGYAAYAEGVRNRDYEANSLLRETFGDLLLKEMERRGWQAVPERGPIDMGVSTRDITPQMKFLPAYTVEKIQSRTKPLDASASTRAVETYLRTAARATTAFKNITLPLSPQWQIGDIIGIFISAAVTGVSPMKLGQYLQEALDANYGGALVEPGQTPTARQRLGQIFADEADRTLTPKGEEMAKSGLQDVGLRIGEQRRMRGIDETEQKTIPQRGFEKLGRPGEVVGGLYPGFRRGAYKINEAINRVGRHAYFLAKLDEALMQISQERGSRVTIDDVIDGELQRQDPRIQAAWEDAVDTANEVMGDWLDLAPWERKYILPHATFYAWVKHVHKLFMKVAKENPAAIKWTVYLGALAYDEESNPFDLYSGLIPLPGGKYASLNFANPFADVAGGPIPKLVRGDITGVTGMLSPVPRLIGGALGVNVARGRAISRPYGTGEVTKTGAPALSPLFQRPGEFLGFAAQQFPIIPRLLDVLPTGTIPGTSIQTGPYERYDTGAARTRPGSRAKVPKVGGRALAAGRLLTVPFMPSTSEDKLRDIQRSAEERLRAFEKARRRAEAQND